MLKVHVPTAKQQFPGDLLPPPAQKQPPLELGMSPGIWERIQVLLGFRPEQASSAEYEKRLPSLKEDEHLATPPIKKEEKQVDSMAVGEQVTIGEVHGIEGDTLLLVVYCLGTFRVYQNEQPIEDWPSSKGKAIFKYLLTHRERPVAKEILMDLFWTDADPDSARNNLNVAIYGLRQALRNDRWKFSHVLFQNDSYQFNPKLRFWIDYEGFTKGMLTAQSLERQGRLANAIREFTSTEALYQGEFLEEDRYEDWLLPLRQRLQDDYLRLLDD
jgi:two-component SAPR family response regulator